MAKSLRRALMNDSCYRKVVEMGVEQCLRKGCLSRVTRLKRVRAKAGLKILDVQAISVEPSLYCLLLYCAVVRMGSAGAVAHHGGRGLPGGLLRQPPHARDRIARLLRCDARRFVADVLLWRSCLA